MYVDKQIFSDYVHFIYLTLRLRQCYQRSLAAALLDFYFVEIISYNLFVQIPHFIFYCLE